MKPQDNNPPLLLAFHSAPGHLIRRGKQRSTSIFLGRSKEFSITPIQYSVLRAVQISPDVDQTKIAEITGLDASTTGAVLARLEKRGLLRARPRGRQRLVTLAAPGTELLKKIRPIIAEINERVMQPLTKKERQQFLRLLSKLVGVTTEFYRVSKKRKRMDVDYSVDVNAFDTVETRHPAGSL